MQGQNSTLLSYVDNQWQTFTSHLYSHELDQLTTCRISKQHPNIAQLKQQYPEINVDINQTDIKPLKNGVYIGKLNAEGRPDGYGMIKNQDGSIVEARFRDGQASGKGFKWFGEDWYYVGDFLDNSFDGRGQYVSPDISYVGQFKSNTFHGQGQLKINKNDGKFIGLMENSEMKEGRLTWKINSKTTNQVLRFQYNGTFLNNEFHGDNCTLESNPGVYKGSFREGKKEGPGRFQFRQKYQYVGEYHNNVKSGFGALYNPEIIIVGMGEECELSEAEKNISYKGNFENNLPHGQGKIYKESEKRLIEAQYKEGIWTEALKSVVD